MFDELIRFLPPSKGGHEEWGRSEAPTPTDLILRSWGQRVVASGGGGKLGVRWCGPSRRLVPHAWLHITGHAGQRQARGRPR